MCNLVFTPEAFVQWILAFDTIRFAIAFLGIVPRGTKFLGRLIYGKYDEDLLARSFVELGYSAEEARKRCRDFKEYIKKMKGTTTVTRENAPTHLILLLAKYIEKFSSPIVYGGDKSNYYINTMEMLHDENDSNILRDIMICLISSEKDIPDAIFSPKTGNPLLISKLADALRRPAIFVKDARDKSRVQSEKEKNAWKINYEGISQINNLEDDSKCIVADCNISGGTQIKNVITEVHREVNLKTKISDAFVLFRVDNNRKDIERIFKDLGVNLHRYFDLDETRKKEIYKIKELAEAEQRMPDYANSKDMESAQEIIGKLKKEKKYYYHV